MTPSFSIRPILLPVIMVVVLFSFSFVSRSDYNGDSILGIYLTPNQKSKIEFIKRDTLYYGILIWNVNPEIKDAHNPSKELRNTSLIGKDIFQEFEYNKYARSWTGKFYDAESGTTYSCDIWLENNKNYLMAKGYIKTPIIGRTEILKRVD